jgi:hypothetical protein
MSNVVSPGPRSKDGVASRERLNSKTSMSPLMASAAAIPIARFLLSSGSKAIAHLRLVPRRTMLVTPGGSGQKRAALAVRAVAPSLASKQATGELG